MVATTEKQSGRSWTYFVWTMFAILFVVIFSVFTYLENHFGAWATVPFGAILFLLYIPLTIAYWIALLVMIVKKRRKSAVSIFVGALVLSIMPLYGRILGDIISYSFDYIRFSYNQRYYLEEAAKRSREDNNQGPVFFDWGSGGFVSTNFFFSLVYDANDTLSMSGAQRLDNWKNAISQQNGVLNSETCRSRVVHLKGRFYSMSTVCQ